MPGVTTTTRAGLRDFLAVLFEGTRGVIELRALPSRARIFVDVDDGTEAESFLGAHVDEDVYVGIATRKDATAGTLANCSALPALFADVDFKVTPEAEARETLAAFPLPPTIIVHSGGGLHVYLCALGAPRPPGRRRVGPKPS
jgi:hypothetical protein